MFLNRALHFDKNVVFTLSSDHLSKIEKTFTVLKSVNIFYKIVETRMRN